MGKILKGKKRIAFGGASVSGEGGGYGFGNINDQAAKSLLLHAYERGIKVFDTAPCYGYHLSEQRIGSALKNVREDVVIISKCGVRWHPNKRLDLTNDPVIAKKMLEDSLLALKTDYIDLYMIHWPDRKVDIRKPMEVLAKAKLEGKINHIGLCNTTTKDISLASEIAKIEVVQSEFNLFKEDVAQDLFPYLKKNNIEFMSYGTFDKGILTGRAHRNRQYDKSDLRSWAPWWKKSGLESKYDKMELIKTYAKKQKLKLLNIALSFNLSYDELTVAICGTRTIEQVDSIIDASDSLITTKELEEIRCLFQS